MVLDGLRLCTYSKLLDDSNTDGPGLDFEKQVPRSIDTMLFLTSHNTCNYGHI